MFLIGTGLTFAQSTASYNFNTSGDLTTYFNSVGSGASRVTQSTTGGIGNTGAVKVPLSSVQAVYSSKSGYSLGDAGSTYRFETYIKSEGNSGYSGMGFTASSPATAGAAGFVYRPNDALGISVHGGGFVFHNGSTDYSGSWGSSSQPAGITAVKVSTVNDLINNNTTSGSPDKWFKVIFEIERATATTFDMHVEVWPSNANGTLRFSEASAIFEVNGVTNTTLQNAAIIHSYFNFSGIRVTHFDNFAINLDGSTVVEEGAPVVFTSSVSASEGVITASGNVTSDGGAAITERGFVYGTSSNPTTSDNKVVVGSGTGTFTGTATPRSAGTYYVRVFATNSEGTSYGEESTVTITRSVPSVDLSFTLPDSISGNPGDTVTFDVEISDPTDLEIDEFIVEFSFDSRFINIEEADITTEDVVSGGFFDVQKVYETIVVRYIGDALDTEGTLFSVKGTLVELVMDSLLNDTTVFVPGDSVYYFPGDSTGIIPSDTSGYYSSTGITFKKADFYKYPSRTPLSFSTDLEIPTYIPIYLMMATTPVEPVLLNLPVTFENDTLNYALGDFGGNVSSIVVDPTDATNKVAKSIKPASAELWAGTTVGAPNGFADAIPFTSTETKMTVRVWSPKAGIPVLLKVEDASDADISVETEDTTTIAGGWQTLEFDFSKEVRGPALNLNNTYDKASIFFNFGKTGAVAGELTFYWDDMMFGPRYLTTFNVYMDLASSFNPQTHDVYISGSAFGWPQPGSNVAYKMSLDKGTIYTYSTTLDAGTYKYKYFTVPKSGPATWDNGEWAGDPDREVTVVAETNTVVENLYGVKPGATVALKDVYKLTDGAPITVEGIVIVPSYGGSNLITAINSGGYGLSVYWSRYGNTDYEAVVGQKIRITGEADFFNNLAQVAVDTLVVVSSNNDIPVPTTLSSIDDWSGDSKLMSTRVRLENVFVPESAPWPTAFPITSSGFDSYVVGNLEATADTFAVRIDKDVPLNDGVGLPRPTQSFNLTGLMSRYRSTIQLLPFSRNDVGIATSNGDDGVLPMEFELKQNFPNPFNPSTQITFALPNASDVTLEVFNVVGQKVGTLVNGRMNPGYHTVNFDASSLASGVYIYRIKAGNFVQVKNMTLIK